MMNSNRPSKKYELFSEGTELTDLASLIMNEDINALEQHIQTGWNINLKIDICEYIEELPINFALIENKLRVVDFLLANKVNLNVKGDPAIVSAAHNCEPETIEQLVRFGAHIDARDRVGKNAFSAALYNDRYELLPFLFKLGLKVSADNGDSFRQAVSENQREAVEFFVEHGIDINKCTPNQVYPYNPTAVSVASSNNNFELVKYLVINGADVTIKDKTGYRPFSYAVENKNIEMQEYLRALEPTEWHNDELRLTALKTYKLPSDLQSFLRSRDRRFKLSCKSVSFVEFQSLCNTKEVKWQGRKFLDLLSEVDNFLADGFLVWSPKDKKLCSADYEHGDFQVLCKWEEFVDDPSKWISKISEKTYGK